MNNVANFLEEKKKKILAEVIEANALLTRNIEKQWESWRTFGEELLKERAKHTSEKEFYEAIEKLGISRKKQSILDAMWLAELNFNAFEVAREKWPVPVNPSALRKKVIKAWGGDFGMPKSST